MWLTWHHGKFGEAIKDLLILSGVARDIQKLVTSTGTQPS